MISSHIYHCYRFLLRNLGFLLSGIQLFFFSFAVTWLFVFSRAQSLENIHQPTSLSGGQINCSKTGWSKFCIISVCLYFWNSYYNYFSIATSVLLRERR